MTSLASPLNLKAWIDDHRHALRPPVGNKCVWEDRDFIVTVIGGPNQRKDFHINPTEELFYQVEGDITLRIIDALGQQRDIPVREGEMFLLPPSVPHSPQRPAATVGLVVERRRPRGEDDQLRFYCERCNEVVYEEQFQLSDIAGQLKRMMDEFWSDATLRTCVHCGMVVTPPSGQVAPPAKDLAFPSDLRVGPGHGGGGGGSGGSGGSSRTTSTKTAPKSTAKTPAPSPARASLRARASRAPAAGKKVAKATAKGR